MKNFILIFIAAPFFLSSCHNDKPAELPADQQQKKSFFPVADFLKGQIHYADSLPTAKLKITTQNNKIDSLYIERAEFNKIAQGFILPELEQNNFEKEFKEASFVDATTQSATFNYTSTNARSALQRIDVLATPDELYSKVKSIFLQETINKADTIIVKKMFWQTNKYFQIVSSIQPPNQAKTISQIKVTWAAGEQ